MSDNPLPSALRAFDERLKRLQERQDASTREAAGEPTTGLGVAFTVTAYIVTGIAVGAGLGWLLDAWLGTKPWLFVVFFFLGAASGMLNVYRMITGMGMAIGYRPAGGDAAAQNKDKPTTGRQKKGQ
mgnify:CR=1 FL=1